MTVHHSDRTLKASETTRPRARQIGLSSQLDDVGDLEVGRPVVEGCAASCALDADARGNAARVLASGACSRIASAAGHGGAQLRRSRAGAADADAGLIGARGCVQGGLGEGGFGNADAATTQWSRYGSGFLFF